MATETFQIDGSEETSFVRLPVKMLIAKFETFRTNSDTTLRPMLSRGASTFEAKSSMASSVNLLPQKDFELDLQADVEGEEQIESLPASPRVADFAFELSDLEDEENDDADYYTEEEEEEEEEYPEELLFEYTTHLTLPELAPFGGLRFSNENLMDNVAATQEQQQPEPEQQLEQPDPLLETDLQLDLEFDLDFAQRTMADLSAGEVPEGMLPPPPDSPSLDMDDVAFCSPSLIPAFDDANASRTSEDMWERKRRRAAWFVKAASIHALRASTALSASDSPILVPSPRLSDPLLNFLDKDFIVAAALASQNNFDSQSSHAVRVKHKNSLRKASLGLRPEPPTLSFNSFALAPEPLIIPTPGLGISFEPVPSPIREQPEVFVANRKRLPNPKISKASVGADFKRRLLELKEIHVEQGIASGTLWSSRPVDRDSSTNKGGSPARRRAYSAAVVEQILEEAKQQSGSSFMLASLEAALSSRASFEELLNQMEQDEQVETRFLAPGLGIFEEVPTTALQTEEERIEHELVFRSLVFRAAETIQIAEELEDRRARVGWSGLFKKRTVLQNSANGAAGGSSSRMSNFWNQLRRTVRRGQ